MCYVCLVGSSEDELRLRLWLSLVPGCTRPSSGGAFAPHLVIIGRDVGLRWGRSSTLSTTSGGGRLRHQVVAMGVAQQQNQICLICCAWVWGGLQRYSIFTPTTASSRWRLRRCWTRHGGDSGDANGRNFRRWRSSLPSVSSFTAVASSQQLHNINSPLQSVFVHAVLGGGGPR